MYVYVADIPAIIINCFSYDKTCDP